MSTPFTILGGYLGAGKTTLINQMLAHPDCPRLGILVNDFGSINIDAQLIQAEGDDLISLTNGCVCCQIGDSLADALDAMLAVSPGFDHLVLEASGVSEPTRLKSYAVGRADLSTPLVITLVDARAIRRQAEDKFIKGLVLQQVREADQILLTKTEGMDPAAHKDLQAWLDRVDAAPSALSPAQTGHLLDLLSRQEPGIRPTSSLSTSAETLPTAHRSLHIALDRPMDADKLCALMTPLPAGLSRVKGFVKSAAGESLTVQATRSGCEVSPGAPAEADYVLIAIAADPAFDFDVLQDEIAACQA